MVGERMEYRRFGKTDLKISAIGFGCWEIGGTYGRIDESEFCRAVAQAIGSGITCFDTAEAYGMGVSEEALARALGPRRNQVVLATKFGVGYDEMPNRRDGSQAGVIASIEKSLQDWRSKAGNLGSLNLFRTLFGPEYFARNLAAVEQLSHSRPNTARAYRNSHCAGH
jgi:diketogulonate reductase-like aldo/keto reductase